MATINIGAEIDVSDVLHEIDTEELVLELRGRGEESEILGAMNTALVRSVVARVDTSEILSEISGRDIASFVVEEGLVDEVLELTTIDDVVSAVDNRDLLNLLIHKMDIIDFWYTLTGHDAFQDIPSGWLMIALDRRGVKLGIPDEVLEASKVIANWVND